MKKGLNRIKEALTRKVGPLPVWAWALIGGAVVYVYRVRHSLTGGAASSATPEQTPVGTPQDPLSLEPGQSVYDPNTGQLLGAAPEQTTPQPQPPVTLEPGEKVYDPNTGQLIGNDAPDPNKEPSSNTAAATGTPGTKKKPHKGPSTKHLLGELGKAHKGPHRKHVLDILRRRHVSEKAIHKAEHPTTHKGKPRSKASTKHHTHAQKSGPSAHPGKPRPNASPGHTMRKRAPTPRRPVTRAHRHKRHR